MRSSTRTTFSVVLIGTSSLPWTRVSGFWVILTLWALAAGINQKPETRNQKKNVREGFTCASTPLRCRRFLVSGFRFAFNEQLPQIKPRLPRHHRLPKVPDLAHPFEHVVNAEVVNPDPVLDL